MSQKISAQELVPFGQNLLQNSTFAMGTSNWGAIEGNVSGVSNLILGGEHGKGLHFMGVPIGGTSYRTQHYEINVQNIDLTLSADLFGVDSWVQIAFYNNGQLVGSGFDVRNTTASIWSRKSCTVKTPNVAYTHARIAVCVTQNNSLTTNGIRNIKLEYGSIATPYTNEGDVVALGKTSPRVDCTLVNGGSGDLSAQKVGNVITLTAGNLRCTSSATFVAVLPDGYYDKSVQYTFPATILGKNNQIANISVSNNGRVFIGNSSSYIPNDGLAFACSYIVTN